MTLEFHSISISRLQENFIEDSTSQVARSEIYERYTNYNNHFLSMSPVSQATMGKLIKTVFPNLKNRRLGQRKNSRYHHVGIRLRFESPMYLLHPMNPSDLNSIDEHNGNLPVTFFNSNGSSKTSIKPPEIIQSFPIL